MTRHNQTCMVPGCGRRFRGFEDEASKLIIWRRIGSGLKSFSVAGPLCPKHRKLADQLAGINGLMGTIQTLKVSAENLIKTAEQAKAGLPL